MAKKVKRAWYPETTSGDTQLAIVENTSRTVDGITDEWQAVKEVIKLRIELCTSDTDLSINSLTSAYNEINARYHKTIVHKAIAMGYRDPRNQNLQNAEYFENLYERDVRRAKKFAKGHYITTGRIIPQDF